MRKSRNKRLLEKVAELVLSPHERKYLMKRMDVIGDIAIIKIDPAIEHKKHEIGKTIIELQPSIRVVLRQVGPTSGVYRTKQLEWIAGEKRTWTIVREYGCAFKVDLKYVFYTPRLSYEHMRIAKLVRPGEVVINMFSGVGLFSILIAKYALPKRVYSIDINPKAYELMVENIRMNKVQDKVIPICDDAADAILRRGLVYVADRILMPLPALALYYLPFALLALTRNGGYIHTYLHVFSRKGSNPKDIAKYAISQALSCLGIRFKIVDIRKVRSVGVRQLQMVVDVWCSGLKDDLSLSLLSKGEPNTYPY